MTTITFLEFQQQPVAVLDRVQAGEFLLILRDGQAVAELRPAAATPLTPRPRGRCAGLFRVPDGFDDPLPDDILRSFEGQ